MADITTEGGQPLVTEDGLNIITEDVNQSAVRGKMLQRAQPYASMSMTGPLGLLVARSVPTALLVQA